MTVVGLGAWCDIVTEDEYRRATAYPVGVPVEAGDEYAGVLGPADYLGTPKESGTTLRFSVREFAILADGRGLTLHDERGFGLSSGAENPWRSVTPESLKRDVRTTVLPDEDDPEDEHPYDWLADLLRAHEVEASPQHLRTVPYAVEFSRRLQGLLAEKG